MPRSGPHRYGEYERAHRKDTQRRVEARRIMEQELGPAALRGKDVDHVVSMKREGNGKGINRRSNLRLRDPRANRADKTY
jgi:hypothetical protein